MPNFKDIAFTLSSLSDVSEILPLIIWFYLGIRKMPYQILGALLMLSFCIKLYSLITAELNINNMPAFHLLALVEIGLISSFYSYLISGKLYLAGLWLVVTVNVLNTIFIQSIWTFNSIAWTFNMIVIILMGLAYFNNLYKNEEDFTPLINRPAFVITAGWLIYASGSFFTYLMGTEILSGTPEGFFKNAWLFQSISTILKNGIMGYGLWLTKENV